MQSLRLPLSDCLDAAVTAAHAGAAILQSYAHNRAELVIDKKMRNDLVSQADREAEEAVIEILRERTPQLGIVAEESGGQTSGIATWYIDPLDGTTNFLHGIPQYAVSIALIAHAGAIAEGDTVLEQDTPVIAVVYDPCREELFTAMHGVGAWLNERRISVSQAACLAESVLGTGFPFREVSNLDEYMRMLRNVMTGTAGIRRPGAAALDLAWVACGRIDGFWEMGLSPWDMAAGALLIREAGGLVADFDGEGNYLDQGRIVAANPKIFSAFLQKLHQKG